MKLIYYAPRTSTQTSMQQMQTYQLLDNEEQKVGGAQDRVEKNVQKLQYTYGA